MVEYLKGGVIRGTKEQRGKTLSPNVGGWKLLGRTRLDGSSSTIDVTSLADKRYYMVLQSVVGKNTVTVDDAIRLGNGSFDTGSNYARRRSVNGGTDTTATSQSSALLASSDTSPQFDVSYMANRSANEKLGITQRVHQSSSGSSSIGNRQEFVWKWTNTSNPIDRWQFWSGGSDTFNAGSEVVVLGWDPDDTHSTNFWEDLGSDTLTAEGTQLDVSFEPKKYLYYQAFIKKDATASNFTEHSINGITTGGTWVRRSSANGGADATATSQNTLNTTDSGAGGYFLEGFIINNASNEKLFMETVVQNTTSGAGTAPDRKEVVFKSTTADRLIKQLTITGATNGYESGSTLRVWGAN